MHAGFRPCSPVGALLAAVLLAAPRPGRGQTTNALTGILQAHGYAAVAMDECAAGQYCVAVSIKGHDLRFLVDTGASFTLIDPDTVKKLGLPLDGRRKGSMAEMTGKRRDHRVTQPVYLRIEHCLVPPLRMVVVNLEPIRSTIAELFSPQIHGIVGSSVLKRHKAVIDYGTPTLYLRDVIPSGTGTTPRP